MQYGISTFSRKELSYRLCLLGPLTVYTDSRTLMIFSVPFLTYMYVYVGLQGPTGSHPPAHAIEDPEPCQSAEIHRVHTVTAPSAQIPHPLLRRPTPLSPTPHFRSCWGL